MISTRKTMKQKKNADKHTNDSRNIFVHYLKAYIIWVIRFEMITIRIVYENLMHDLEQLKP